MEYNTYQSKTALATVSGSFLTQEGSLSNSTDAPCFFKYSSATVPVTTGGNTIDVSDKSEAEKGEVYANQISFF
jgi:hypothetical protein